MLPYQLPKQNIKPRYLVFNRLIHYLFNDNTTIILSFLFYSTWSCMLSYTDDLNLINPPSSHLVLSRLVLFRPTFILIYMYVTLFNKLGAMEPSWLRTKILNISSNFKGIKQNMKYFIMQNSIIIFHVFNNQTKF